MKYIILFVTLFILIACDSSDSKKLIPSYNERELSFSHLKNGYDVTNSWIKDPDNIIMLHETFKKIGYNNLVNRDLWEGKGYWYLDVNKSPQNWIDSLELTYSNFEFAPKYYREFWQRRKVDNNDKVVYNVVREIKQIFIDNGELDYSQALVNDTLNQLLELEYPKKELPNSEVLRKLNYLIKIGLHQSVYNIISGEHEMSVALVLDKPATDYFDLLQEVKLSQRAWFEDNTK